MSPRLFALFAIVFLWGWALAGRTQAQQQPGNPVIPPLDTPFSGVGDRPPLQLPPQGRMESPSSVDPRPFRPLPGWFAGVEIFLPTTHVSGTQWEGGDPPVSKLSLTVSPQAMLGYRYEDGSAFLASYRFLGASGDDTVTGNHDQVYTNWLDLDYHGRLHGPSLWFTFQWQMGLRLAEVSHDTHSANLDMWGRDDTTFVGAGPHGGMDINWYLAQTGLGVFGRLDLGLPIGAVWINSESHALPLPNTVNFGPTDASQNTVKSRALFTLQGAIGLSWTPPTTRWLRVEGGVQLFDFIVDTYNFASSGPFLRGEIGF